MRLGIKLYPKSVLNEFDPGHMAIFWDCGNAEFRGYRFNPKNLPKQYRSASTWRQYLFTNRTPGYIVPEPGVADLCLRNEAFLRSKEWLVDDRLEGNVRQEAKPRQSGYYSFNPDSLQCHNCVTWATSVVNGFISGALPRVREGRIKEMLQHLEQSP